MADEPPVVKNETEEQVKSPSEQLNCNGEKKDWAEQSAEKPLELSDAARPACLEAGEKPGVAAGNPDAISLRQHPHHAR